MNQHFQIHIHRLSRENSFHASSSWTRRGFWSVWEVNLSLSEWKLGPYAVVFRSNVPRVFRSFSESFEIIESSTDTSVRTIYFNPETLRRLMVEDVPEYGRQDKNLDWTNHLWGAKIKIDNKLRKGFVKAVGMNGDTSENILAPINIEGMEHMF